jgi:hypothetical protein
MATLPAPAFSKRDLAVEAPVKNPAISARQIDPNSWVGPINPAVQSCLRTRPPPSPPLDLLQKLTYSDIHACTRSAYIFDFCMEW